MAYSILINHVSIPFKIYFIFGVVSTLLFVFSILINLHNLPIVQNIDLIFSFISIVLFSFIIGFVVLLPFRNNISLFNLIYFPIIISTGLLVNLIWIFSLSVFTLDLFVMNSLLIISFPVFFIFFIKHYKNRLRCTQFLSKKELIKQIILLITFLIILTSIASLIDLKEYPVLHSDLSDYHALLIQSIIHQDKVSFIYNHEIMHDVKKIDYANSTIPYPQGFHATTAVYSKFFEINPTQQGFVINGIVISLIFGSIISLSFTISKSYLISLVSVMSFFYVALDGGNQEFYLFGNFIIGLSPSLLGLLGIILTLTLLFSINSKKNYSLSIFFVLLISIGVIHPPSTVYLILIFFAHVALNFNRQFFNTIKKSFKLIFSRKFSPSDLVLCIILIGVILGGTYVLPLNAISGYSSPANFSHIVDGDHDLLLGLSRIIDDGFFLSSFIMLYITLFFNIFYIKENRSFSVIILIFTIPIFFVSSSEFLTLLFVPIRLSVLLIPLTWIMLGITICSIEKFISTKLSKPDTKMSSKISLSYETSSKNHWFLHYRILTIIFFIVSITLLHEHIFTIFNFDSIIYQIFPGDGVQCTGISLYCK
jgi:hypothetical protein